MTEPLTEPLRVVFFGTPEFSIPTFETLLDSPDLLILAAVTQPDKPSGRGQKLTPPPVKALAETRGLPVFQPVSIRKDTELLDWLRSQQPDFFVTIAFGQILSQEVLDIPKYGTVNVHASLLPELRGANPIQWAILQGKTETGITTMLTDIGVDTGDMLLRETVSIGPNDTTPELFEAMARTGGPLLVKTLCGLRDGSVTPQPQPHEAATHAPKLTKEDAFLDWSQTAEAVHNKIRGQQPWPGAVTFLNGERIKIIRSHFDPSPASDASFQNTASGSLLKTTEQGLLIQAGQGVLEILMLQPPGKGVMRARDWVNGSLRGQIAGIVFEPAPAEAAFH